MHQELFWVRPWDSVSFPCKSTAFLVRNLKALTLGSNLIPTIHEGERPADPLFTPRFEADCCVPFHRLISHRLGAVMGEAISKRAHREVPIQLHILN